MKVNIKKLIKTAQIPRQATLGASGYDLYSIEEVTLHPGEIKLVPTGVAMEIPFGYEGQVRPRSGLAFKKGITVLNTPGTIDSDYRGEIKVILINHSVESVSLDVGERIAQIVFQKVEQVEFIDAVLTETDRGSGGFGHSGTK